MNRKTKGNTNLPLIVALAGSVLALLGLFIIDAMAEPEPFPEFELEDGLTSKSVTRDAMMGEASVSYTHLTLPTNSWG